MSCAFHSTRIDMSTSVSSVDHFTVKQVQPVQQEMSTLPMVDSDVKMDDKKDTGLSTVTRESLEAERKCLTEQDDEMTVINIEELRPLIVEVKAIDTEYHGKMTDMCCQQRELAKRKTHALETVGLTKHAMTRFDLAGLTDYPETRERYEIETKQAAEIENEIKQLDEQQTRLAEEYGVSQEKYKALIKAAMESQAKRKANSFKNWLDWQERKAGFETDQETKYLDKEAKAAMEPFKNVTWPILHLYVLSSVKYDALGDNGERTSIRIKTDSCTVKVLDIVRSQRDRVTIHVKATESCKFIDLGPIDGTSMNKQPRIGSRFCLSLSLEHLKLVERHDDKTMSLAVDFGTPGYASVWSCGKD